MLDYDDRYISTEHYYRKEDYLRKSPVLAAVYLILEYVILALYPF